MKSVVTAHFQFRLSTVIVAAFTMSGMIGLNFVVYRGKLATTYDGTGEFDDISRISFFNRDPYVVTGLVEGWPFYHGVDLNTLVLNNKPYPKEKIGWRGWDFDFRMRYLGISWILSLIFDAFIAACVTLLFKRWLLR